MNLNLMKNLKGKNQRVSTKHCLRHSVFSFCVKSSLSEYHPICFFHCSLRTSSVLESFKGKIPEVALQLSSLYSLHARGETGDSSTFASNGSDPDRIKQLLRDPPCQCGCRMPYNLLKKTCDSFWGLPKESQDALLWSLQVQSGRKRRWSIEGLGVQKMKRCSLAP